ncbi:MAG: tetratricopeptide repeat protein [Myxococcota bacterium]
MEQAEVDQEVTDLLLLALEFSNHPPAAMVYCRQSIECIIHNKYFQEVGEKPKEDEQGKFPSLLAITKKVKKSLGKQTARVVGSINIQSRGPLHWDFDSRGRAAKPHHVNAVIDQIVITHKDIFDSEIVLEGLRIDDVTLESTVKKTVDNKLTQQGITNDYETQAKGVNEDEVENILEIVGAASAKGIELEPWEQNRLGRAAYWAGKYEVAKKYHQQALRRFEESNDMEGEASVLLNLGNLHKVQASDGNELNEALEMYTKSRSISKKINKPEDEAKALNSIGAVSWRAAQNFAENNEEKQDYVDNSLENYEACLAIYRDIGLMDEVVGLAKGNVGLIHLSRGELNEAEKQIKDSLAIFNFLENKYRIAWANMLLADYLLRIKKTDEATALVNSTLEICQEEYRAWEAQCYRILGKIAYRKNDFAEAERNYKDFVRILNEIGERLPRWMIDNGLTDPNSSRFAIHFRKMIDEEESKEMK